jgi:hypothetical protein
MAKGIVNDLNWYDYTKIIFFLGKWRKSEAEIFQDVAFEHGVPKTCIFVETNSTNTGENIRFSYQILSEMQRLPTKVILVQKPTSLLAIIDLINNMIGTDCKGTSTCKTNNRVITATVVPFHKCEIITKDISISMDYIILSDCCIIHLITEYCTPTKHTRVYADMSAREAKLIPLTHYLGN